VSVNIRQKYSVSGFGATIRHRGHLSSTKSQPPASTKLDKFENGFQRALRANPDRPELPSDFRDRGKRKVPICHQAGNMLENGVVNFSLGETTTGTTGRGDQRKLKHKRIGRFFITR
jgi:hypothetical protein